jgi:hypothetical protein
MPLHTYLRAWTDRFTSQGFVLALIEQTYGEAVRSVPLSPVEEADSLDWYYHTYLKLPVILGVVNTAVIQRVTPPADGRRWWADTTALGRKIGVKRNNPAWKDALLYDRNGRLLFFGNLQENVNLLQALIIRALASHSSSGGTHP